MEIGGPATNAAITYAHLSGSANLATLIGQHPLTTYFEQQFRLYRLTHTDICPGHPLLPTIASVFTSTDNGDRSIITNKPAVPQISPNLVSQLLKFNPQLVLVDGFYMQTAIQLAQEARKAGIPVVLDGGSWKTDMEKLLPHVDIAICSADFHLPENYPGISVYFREMGIQHYAITHGEQPIFYQSRSIKGHIPVKP